MKHEIERKFLLDISKLPFIINNLDFVDIEQGYLIWNEEGGESRLRKIGDRYKLTFKKGKGTDRLEIEIDITKEQFNYLWPMTESKRLFKRRYYHHDKDHRIEIDVYSGKAAGLTVAEVEFENIEDYGSFIPPVWFGKEVSEDESFRNRNLAVE